MQKSKFYTNKKSVFVQKVSSVLFEVQQIFNIFVGISDGRRVLSRDGEAHAFGKFFYAVHRSSPRRIALHDARFVERARPCLELRLDKYNGAPAVLEQRVQFP